MCEPVNSVEDGRDQHGYMIIAKTELLQRYKTGKGFGGHYLDFVGVQG